MLNLDIFAYHVACIMTNPAPAKFGLYTLGNLHCKVEIVKSNNPDFQDPIWDTVTINGQNCGNRFGGMQYFTQLVKPETTK